MNRICAFTGHRFISPPHAVKLPGLLARAIAYAYNDEGCRTFYSGGAIGFDTLAAREVIRFRMSHPDVRLVMYLPCLDQDAKWSPGQSEAYEHILSCADEIKYVSDEYTKDCMRRRNAAMAEDADIMIAYIYRSNSGSAQTARMAERLGKSVYNLYPTLDGGEG